MGFAIGAKPLHAIGSNGPNGLRAIGGNVNFLFARRHAKLLQTYGGKSECLVLRAIGGHGVNASLRRGFASLGVCFFARHWRQKLLFK